MEANQLTAEELAAIRAYAEGSADYLRNFHKDDSGEITGDLDPDDAESLLGFFETDIPRLLATVEAKEREPFHLRRCMALAENVILGKKTDLTGFEPEDCQSLVDAAVALRAENERLAKTLKESLMLLHRYTKSSAHDMWTIREWMERTGAASLARMSILREEPEA